MEIKIFPFEKKFFLHQEDSLQLVVLYFSDRNHFWRKKFLSADFDTPPLLCGQIFFLKMFLIDPSLIPRIQFSMATLGKYSFRLFSP